MEKNELTALLASYEGKPQDIIRALQDIQHEYGYLSKNALQTASRLCTVPYSYVYAIASFYKAFSLKERGRYVIRVCDGTACHLKLSGDIKDELGLILGIKENETTADGLFTIEMVNCLGACAMAPVVSINEKLFGYLNRTKIRRIINEIKTRGEEALQ